MKKKTTLEDLHITSFITASARLYTAGRAAESEDESVCRKTCIPDCTVAGTCEAIA